MLDRLRRFLAGSVTLRVEGDENDVIAYLLAQGIAAHKMARRDGALEIEIDWRERKKIAPLLDKSPALVYIKYKYGLPALLLRYRLRPGIPVGAAIFALLLWASTLFIWDIRFVGLETVPEERAAALLSELGCRTGSFLPAIDFYELCNDYIAQSHEISWISVNMRGNIAYVEVREAKEKPEPDDRTYPANLVARRSGVICGLQLAAGRPAVLVGDLVREGELLASGVYLNKKETAFRLLHAEGKVFARTTRTISVTVPYVGEEKVYTGEQTATHTISVLGRSLTFGTKSTYEACDCEENTEQLKLFGDIVLPIRLTGCVYSEYRMIPVTYTDAEVHAMAERALEEKLEAELSSAEVLTCDLSEETVTDEAGNTALVLTAAVSCIEDIAVEQKIG